MRTSQVLQALRAYVAAHPLAAEHVQVDGDALHLSVQPFAVGVEAEIDHGAHLAFDLWRQGAQVIGVTRTNDAEGLQLLSEIDFLLVYAIREGQERDDYDRALDLMTRLTCSLMDESALPLLDAVVTRLVRVCEVVAFPSDAPFLLLASTIEVQHMEPV